MKNYKKKILSLIFISFFIIMPIFSFFNIQETRAGSLWSNQEGKDEIGAAFGETSDEPTDVREFTAAIIFAFLGLMGLVFVILIISAGYKWMMAGGNEEAVTKAKAQLQNSIIGLTIIAAAYSITYFVTEKLYDISSGYY